MIITILELLQASEALKQASGKELPSKLSYWLGRLQTKIDSPLKEYEKKKHDLFKKYGDKDEAKDTLTVPDDKKQVFFIEVSELQKIEEEINFNPIKLELFDGSNFSKEFFILMDKFITE